MSWVNIRVSKVEEVEKRKEREEEDLPGGDTSREISTGGRASPVPGATFSECVTNTVGMQAPLSQHEASAYRQTPYTHTLAQKQQHRIQNTQ